jgi:hypothetical protein
MSGEPNRLPVGNILQPCAAVRIIADKDEQKRSRKFSKEI